MIVQNLWYLFELSAFICALWFQGRRTKNEVVEGVTTQLITQQTSLITAQEGRIALLEAQNKEQAATIEKQAGQLAEYKRKLDYLEGIVSGHPSVVQAGPLGI